MNSFNFLPKRQFINNSEVKSEPYKSNYIFQQSQDNIENISKILSKTEDCPNHRTHRHQHFFYSNNRINNKNDLQEEVNKLREENRLIKEEYENINKKFKK